MNRLGSSVIAVWLLVSGFSLFAQQPVSPAPPPAPPVNLIPPVTAAVVAVSAISWQHHEVVRQRVALARSVAAMAESSALPGVEALKNYDVIQRMSESQRPDDKLLALMQ